MSEQKSDYFTPDQKQLPYSEVVDTAALSRLFKNTTNSYKHIFFISILDILKRRNFDSTAPITFEDLVVEMLANAWYPYTYFKLFFGRQDQITKNLDSLNLEISEPIFNFFDTDKILLRHSIASQELQKIILSLQRFVPFRLLVPFFENELKDIPNKHAGDVLDRAMPRVAEKLFDIRKPLYRFDSESHSACKAIIIHPEWAEYLEKHYAIIRGWASWEWLGYMQKRNPNTPNLIHKLFAPVKRSPLKIQKTYWQTVLRAIPFNCIYSGRRIEPDRFSLDHYLPWSFVAHDQLWNLIPTAPEINSSKSNDLPPSTSLQNFIIAQHLGLRTFVKLNSQRQWQKVSEDYIVGLGISKREDLLHLETLETAYHNVIQPLLSLASNQGFKVWQSPFLVL